MSGGECHTTLRVSMAVSATPFKWSAADYTFLPKILEQMSKDNRFPAILTQKVRVAAGLETSRPHGLPWYFYSGKGH